jgi:hypothetical protein
VFLNVLRALALIPRESGEPHADPVIYVPPKNKNINNYWGCNKYLTGVA